MAKKASVNNNKNIKQQNIVSKDTKQMKKIETPKDTKQMKVLKDTKQMKRIESDPVQVKEKKKFSLFKKKEKVEYAPINIGKKSKVDLSKGLSSKAVEERTVRGYVNKTHSGSTKTIRKIIFSNVVTFFNMIMILIAVWLISVGSWKNIISFMAVVSMNTIIGIVQEIRAKKTIDSLSLLSSPVATVLRDGEQQEIAITDIVIDDILIFNAGKQICADSVVKEGTVEVNESLLTGESDAIVKKEGDILLSGSFIISGECKARVEKVGKDNYIETLSAQAKKYSKPKSDLLRSLNLIIRTISILIIPIGVILFINTYMGTNSTYAEAVIATAGGVIGMIPSGLFLTTSIALAVGVINLAKNKTLVQELYCIEMLARINVLCLDKTGTITDGSMTVKNDILLDSKTPDIKNIISTMNYALKENNQTGQALIAKYGKAKKYPVADITPFSSARKYSVVKFEKIGTYYIGAPEFILKDKYSLVSEQVEKQAALGYRVLLLARTDSDKKDMTPVALIIIEDTIRKDAVQTITYFKNSGVEVKVISGDNPLTVSKVALRAGISHADEYISLDGLTDEQVKEAATKYTVFGRVNPRQKQLLVKTLKENGGTVAMTGDGVNDILALKEADCSIAMASGSEATRNVSQLVLLDSNFSSMPKVVREGRRVINNVERVATLFLTKTIFSFVLSLLVILLKKPYPIQTIQLFLVDFLVIGIPSFILAIEPNNSVIKGKFLINVFKDALPGALVVITNILIVYGFAGKLNLTNEAVSTIIVLSTTVTCMMVLFRVCKPFNFLRGLLFFSMFTLFILCTAFLGKIIFDFVSLDTPSIILLCLLIETSYILLKIYGSAYKKIKEWIINYLVKVYKIVDADEYYY
ncbi:MAG: HAD family hydrolase [Erysipelotrichaceae bacterium]|nr:HAD family hydrolase [Erysipelotrichaceae bacterium]